jgi:hypothetical protein
MNLMSRSLVLALAIFCANSLTAFADTAPPAHPVVQTPAEHAEAIEQRWYLSGLIVVLLGVGAAYRLKSRKRLT